ncbi:MAG: hypothetical protein KA085_13165 [Phenylobacterium sp.]|uniref:TOPRIM nucleotidyl transferase/hydrolase domain-containing protein n=1 Tax=Phenylobacterium sp. TaxID=1871053 RepID=UPI001B735891|nr:TOPRIM nucleotidyl transferase/hydrolase domain-containing protein [Phenylobacterium sp.]MBP7817073.1 hypothetical protein [Phenylobacterium sp.]
MTRQTQVKVAGMKTPANIFDMLTGPGAYKVKRLLRASEFAKFVSDRGERVDEARLRKLELLGLFKPLLRIRRQDAIYKIETIEGNRFRDLGPLDDDEVWEGETRTELNQFGFRPDIVASWREHGVLWSPWDGPSEHDGEIDAEPQRHEAYYSEFQIWDLMWMLSSLTLHVSADNAFNGDGTPNDNHQNLAENIAEMVSEARARPPNPRRVYGLFAQLISDRFYVQTQGDERLITVSKDGQFHGWEWEDYARTWTPDEIIAQFQFDQTNSANIESQLSAQQRFANPLDAWRALTRFVALTERKRLKGKALLAETLGEMAEMHRLFHRLAFGVALPDPNETGFPLGGPAPPPVADDPYSALEWVTNRFHLNPKPKLVLIVEGQTEEVVIPAIFERWFGAPAARYGIQVRNMHGVGNATGTKRDRQSALWRLVDFLHAQQTIALVLLDREGLAGPNIAKGLASAISIHFPDRKVTRQEYIKLWNRCFELDNFSDSEIAAAMTALSGGVVFKGSDIKPCRVAPASKVKAVTIETVYRGRVGHSLNKVALALELVERMFDPKCKRSPANRPIIRFLSFAANRAALNHQPTNFERWEYNQRSGYLGTLRPGAVSRRRKPTR